MRTYSLCLLLFATGFLTGCGEDFLPSSRRKPYGGIKIYMEQLEAKLLAQYQNHPEYGSQVAKVKLDIIKNIKSDGSGKRRRVEFSQLVYNIWGERIPALEKEYFVITFGPAGERRKSRAPKLSIGLDANGDYSEYQPVMTETLSPISDKNTRIQSSYCPVCGKKTARSGLCRTCALLSTSGKAESQPQKAETRNNKEQERRNTPTEVTSSPLAYASASKKDIKNTEPEAPEQVRKFGGIAEIYPLHKSRVILKQGRDFLQKKPAKEQLTPESSQKHRKKINPFENMH